MKKFWKGSAYTILSIHVAFTFFILLTPLVILIGKWQICSWTQDPTFRNIHIGLLTFVLVEVIFSIPCFLTVMENNCRKKSDMPLYCTGFFDYWIEIFCDFRYRNWLFITIFSLISVLSYILYFAVPPLSS